LLWLVFLTLLNQPLSKISGAQARLKVNTNNTQNNCRAWATLTHALTHHGNNVNTIQQQEGQEGTTREAVRKKQKRESARERESKRERKYVMCSGEKENKAESGNHKGISNWLCSGRLTINS
jgi:aspartokinase